METLLKFHEAAKILSISESTLRHAVSSHSTTAPPYIKLGSGGRSAVRFRESDLSEWVESRVRNKGKIS